MVHLFHLIVCLFYTANIWLQFHSSSLVKSLLKLFLFGWMFFVYFLFLWARFYPWNVVWESASRLQYVWLSVDLNTELISFLCNRVLYAFGGNKSTTTSTTATLAKYCNIGECSHIGWVSTTVHNTYATLHFPHLAVVSSIREDTSKTTKG